MLPTVGASRVPFSQNGFNIIYLEYSSNDICNHLGLHIAKEKPKQRLRKLEPNTGRVIKPAYK